MTISLDTLLVVTILLSAILYGYFALMRQDAPPPKRKVVTFWRDILFLSLAALTLRLFFVVFPSISPDHFFLMITTVAGALYAYYAIVRRHAEESAQRGIVAFWRDIFFCFAIVFIVRGFFFDYFRIPSNSMQPTLKVGDVVLTSKNAYGYRLPVFNIRLSAGDNPQRGDVVVFRKPREDLFYIKRIIGLPGDMVRYGDDRLLTINSEIVITTPSTATDDVSGYRYAQPLREQLNDGWHDILVEQSAGVLYQSPDSEHCQLSQTEKGYALSCQVPAGHYFVLGDNRDHSNDSRFWGFVPRQNMVGPASHILFNYHRFDRLWQSLQLTDQ